MIVLKNYKKKLGLSKLEQFYRPKMM